MELTQQMGAGHRAAWAPGKDAVAGTVPTMGSGGAQRSSSSSGEWKYFTIKQCGCTCLSRRDLTALTHPHVLHVMLNQRHLQYLESLCWTSGHPCQVVQGVDRVS